MLKLVYVCDKCGKEVEVELVEAMKVTHPRFEAPADWVAEVIDANLVLLCDDCNGDILTQKAQVEAIQAQVVADVRTALEAE